MSTYPSLSKLVDGMQGGGTTDLWDVVVSYSIDRLNKLLQKLWVTDTTFDEIQFTTQSMLPTGDLININWRVKIGSPTLSFTLDGRAILSMSVSGSHQAEGTNPSTGEPYPIIELPANSYQLDALVPLVSVRAKEGSNVGTDPTVRQTSPYIDCQLNKHPSRTLITSLASETILLQSSTSYSDFLTRMI